MRERQQVLIVASTSLFFSVLVWFNYSAVLPLIVEEWGLTGTEAGVVFGTFQAGYLVAIVPAGWLADRYSPRWVIAVGATGTAAPSLAFAALADGLLSGTLLRFLSGAFVAGVYVPGMRFVSEWFPEAVRGRALGLYVGTFSVGSGLSFVFATVAAEAVDWRLAIALTSVGALFVAPLILGLTRDHPAREESDTSDGVLDRSLLRNREFLCAVSIYSWHNWELFGIRNWLLAFLVAAPAFAATDSAVLPGLVVGAMIVMSGVGNAAGGWLSDRVGRKRTIATGLAASASLSAVFGLLGDLRLAVLIAITLGYGVVISLDSAPTSTLVTEVVDDRRVGTALSLQSLVGFSTTVVSPVVFGLALDRAGYAAAFPTLAAGALLGLLSVGALAVVQRTRAPY
ncbi:MFS transporter [Natronolimnohabitans innermongolicus]|uniref:Major facilitator superfamily protein n=1 Tax=Natronolimnohabitans innermongolicus JCM 12255 TaxID=1227499 RepID=L9XNI5_9EURY|nr:MFS transporter [Natronolimnohabitans innermongolicus]ELY62208.1 major facilitator superfamily protein [Natronolimnohabitans innermongolicus JCM 12255]